MTGVKDYNYPEFMRVEKSLTDHGFKTFNPAKIKIDTTDLTEDEIWQVYMDVCLPVIERCKTIYLLKGWETSKGAKLELKRAIELNLKIVQQGDFI